MKIFPGKRDSTTMSIHAAIFVWMRPSGRNWVLLKVLETSKSLCSLQCQCVLCTLIRDVTKVTMSNDRSRNWPLLVANYEYVENEIIELCTHLFRAGVQPAWVNIGETLRCMLSAWFRTSLQGQGYMLDASSNTVLAAAAVGQSSIELSRRSGLLTKHAGGVGTLWCVMEKHKNDFLEWSPTVEDHREYEDGQTKYRNNNFFMILKNWVKLEFKLGGCTESVEILMHKGSEEEMYPDEGLNELILKSADVNDPKDWKFEIRQTIGNTMMVHRRIQVYRLNQVGNSRPGDGFEFSDVFCCTKNCIWEIEAHIHDGHTHIPMDANASGRYIIWPPDLRLLRIGIQNCKSERKQKCNDSIRQGARKVLSAKQVEAISVLFPVERCSSIFEFFRAKSQTWGILGASIQRSECDAWFDSIFLGYDNALITLVDASVDFMLSLMRFQIADVDTNLQASAGKLCSLHAFLISRYGPDIFCECLKHYICDTC